jgi:hypothetical protein
LGTFGGITLDKKSHATVPLNSCDKCDARRTSQEVQYHTSPLSFRIGRSYGTELELSESLMPYCYDLFFIFKRENIHKNYTICFGKTVK